MNVKYKQEISQVMWHLFHLTENTQKRLIWNTNCIHLNIFRLQNSEPGMDENL
jgi:hypothetical protein